MVVLLHILASLTTKMKILPIVVISGTPLPCPLDRSGRHEDKQMWWKLDVPLAWRTKGYAHSCLHRPYKGRWQTCPSHHYIDSQHLFCIIAEWPDIRMSLIIQMWPVTADRHRSNNSATFRYTWLGLCKGNVTISVDMICHEYNRVEQRRCHAPKFAYCKMRCECQHGAHHITLAMVRAQQAPDDEQDPVI